MSTVDITAPLRSKVALITGGASGIGLATAHELGRRGATVALAFNPAHPHDGVTEASRLASEGLDVRAYPVDVANPSLVNGLFDDLLADVGPPAIVVANAAVARRVPLGQPWSADWNEVIATNLSGVYHTFMAAIPSMMKLGGGRLLATTSVSGPVVGWGEHAAYCASKAGIVGLVRSLALDVAKHSITVNALAPGTIRTPQSLDPVNSLGPEGLDRASSGIPIGRVGTPEDVAATFAFLAGDDAGYITGQMIVIDGGVTLVESM